MAWLTRPLCLSLSHEFFLLFGGVGPPPVFSTHSPSLVRSSRQPERNWSHMPFLGFLLPQFCRRSASEGGTEEETRFRGPTTPAVRKASWALLTPEPTAVHIPSGFQNHIKASLSWSPALCQAHSQMPETCSQGFSVPFLQPPPTPGRPTFLEAPLVREVVGLALRKSPTLP